MAGLITIRINQRRLTLTIDLNPIFDMVKKKSSHIVAQAVILIGRKSSKFRLFYYNHTKKYDWGLVQFIKDMDKVYPSEHKTDFEKEFKI